MVPVMTANVDGNGLFVTAAGDGGDSLANNASFELASRFCRDHDLNVITNPIIRPWWNGTFQSASKLFQSSAGVWVRNPQAGIWYDDPRTTSRDQILPTMLAMGLNKQYKDLWSTQWRILLRCIPVIPFIPLFWSQNIYANWTPIAEQTPKCPDTFIGHLHLFIRCWGWFALPLYPVLFVLDLFLLIASLIDVYGSENKDPNNCDDRNGINCHIAALNACPTPISWLARRIYSRGRPATSASIAGWAGGVETNHVMGALRLYFWENNPILAESYRPIIEKYFS